MNMNFSVSSCEGMHDVTLMSLNLNTIVFSSFLLNVPSGRGCDCQAACPSSHAPCSECLQRWPSGTRRPQPPAGLTPLVSTLEALGNNIICVDLYHNEHEDLQYSLLASTRDKVCAEAASV
jgi:hypothetical protein